MVPTDALAAKDFLQTLGINTHIDFYGQSYGDLGKVEMAIEYLGVVNLRDSPADPADLTLWQQVANATGAKFDAYVGETSPAGMSVELGYIQQLAQRSIVNFIEGPNEEDDAYPTSLGNNLDLASAFQATVYAAAQSLGLPVINMSFGAGWTPNNDWHGDYDKVGDLSGVADFANAHTYPADAPDVTIQQLNDDAHLAATSLPVITTELGYNLDIDDATDVAKWTLDAALDGAKDSDGKTYFYAMFDDSSGAFGLFNSDGSPRPAATALHNLTSLLQDNGSPNTGTLDYTIGNTVEGDNSLLLEKSDGTYWLALWNEENSGHSVTVDLASPADATNVFDPLTGTSAVQSSGSTSSVDIWVPDHPVLLEISPSGTGASSAPVPETSGTSGPQAAGGPVVIAPTSVAGSNDQLTAIPGVTLADPFASDTGTPVDVTVRTADTSLATVDAWGNPQTGSTLSLSGTIWQVNAGLANLQYEGSGDKLQIVATDQAGGQTATTISIGSATLADPNNSTTAIAMSETSAVITASNTSIVASAGDHMIFISGNGDTLTATGGTESVQAYTGGNTITTGDDDDTIRFAGSRNIIDAGAGTNRLEDSGSGNTIVLPNAGEGADNIFGWVTQNGDNFDLRPALAQTNWSGDPAILGDYIQVTPDGNDVTVSIDPDGTGGGNAFVVATLNDGIGEDLNSFIAHAIT